MTYKGTVGTGGSFASEIDVQSDNIYVYQVDISTASNVLVPISIGDTLLCKTDILYGDRTLPAGTMLIARSEDGTENTNGGIDSDKLTFDIIESTKASDTTYRFINIGTNGIALRSSSGVNAGTIDFLGEDGLSVEWTGTVDAVGNFVDKVIHIKHNPVVRTDTTGTAEQQSATMTMKIPVITKVETDDNGHITGVQTTDYTVVDSTSQVSKVDLEANQYVASDEKTQVGSITTKVTTVDGSSKQTMQEDSFNIVSKSLEIKVDNNYGSTEGTETTTRQHGLSINMVWGEF